MNHDNGIGILGGSFDPIHIGHTQSAQAVANELGLTKILLIPAYISPLKTTPDLLPHASPEQRATMVNIACQKNTLFTCDTQELERAGNSYTVDTLKALKIKYPNQPLHFIIGMDSLITLTLWHKYEELLSLCHLIVNTRPNHNISNLNPETLKLLKAHQAADKKELLEKDCGKIFFTNPIFYDISSTTIRQRISQHKHCNDLLIPEISDYINKNGLYR